MQKLKSTLSRILWLYLYLNPVLDIVSGSYIYFRFGDLLDVFNDANIGITPSLIFRMLMLILFAVYILIQKDKRSIMAAIPLGVAWALSVLSEYISFGGINLMIDVQYFAKFCYNVAILLTYENLFRHSGMNKAQILDRIHKILCIVTFILAAGIIIPYILDFGFYTYADRFGYRGFRGVYYSGNDITATLMLIAPITLCRFMSISGASIKEKIFYGSAPALSILCLLIIGTKTAYVAVLITVVFLTVYSVYLNIKKKDKTPLLNFLMVMGAVIISALLLSIISGRSVLATILSSFLGFEAAAEESTKTLVMSGRQNILKTTMDEYRYGGIITWLFGLGRGSQEKVIEMDLFEVVFYYGIFGAISMLWLYFKIGIGFVKNFFKGITLPAMGTFIALGTCVSYLTMAGHVLFSVTSGFYFAFILLYGVLIYKKENGSGESLSPSQASPR